MKYEQRTFWTALTEWLKWRPRRMSKKCPVCRKRWRVWTTDMYYIPDICSVKCADAAYELSLIHI